MLIDFIIALIIGLLIVGSCSYLSHKVAIFILIICSLVGGCSYINHRLKLKDDHPAEELLENFIQNETGLDLDLTPDTPEKNA